MQEAGSPTCKAALVRAKRAAAHRWEISPEFPHYHRIHPITAYISTLLILRTPGFVPLGCKDGTHLSLDLSDGLLPTPSGNLPDEQFVDLGGSTTARQFSRMWQYSPLGLGEPKPEPDHKWEGGGRPNETRAKVEGGERRRDRKTTRGEHQ